MAQGNIGERGDGHSIPGRLQFGHMTDGVADIVHVYISIVQASIQVVVVIRIPCTGPDWTGSLIAEPRDEMSILLPVAAYTRLQEWIF